MYYVVEIEFQDLNDYAYIQLTPIDDPDAERLFWKTGELMSKQREVGVLYADTSEEDGTKLKDVFPNQFEGIILNKRCIEVLKSVGVKNLEVFPLIITNHETGEEITDYRMCNIVGKISCLDMESSICEESTQIPGMFEYFERLVIDTKKIDEFNKRMGEGGPLKMFRMEENRWLLIAHEDVKAAIEEAKIVGWVFTETNLYQG